MTKISVVIVTYNSASVIKGALSTLSSVDNIKEIIVVDNASADDTCKIIAQDFPQVKLVENKENLGFGVANNIALEQINSDYALLLNPDAEIDDSSINALLSAAEKYKNSAILAPQITLPDGSLQESWKRNVFDREKYGSGKFIEPVGDLCADFLSGAVMLLRTEYFKGEIGFFDPNIFLFYEDDDLCLKAKEAGYELVLVSGAKAKHIMGGSSEHSLATDGFKQKQMIISRIYLEKKYHGEKAAKQMAKKILVHSLLKFILYSLVFNSKKKNRYRARMSGLKSN